MALLQDFNDSQVGVVLGTVLHTLGAIAFLGGLVGYIAWHRHLRRGHHHRGVLDASAALTYFAIVVNLLGGFMRTYETGHPHLTEFGTSAWVRAIAIKHLFLFVAYGAAIFLFEVVAKRHLRAMKAGAYEKAGQTGHRLGVLLVALGIIVSAVLGGVSTVLPVAAADAGMEDEHDDHTENETLPDRYLNASGQLSGFVPGQSAVHRATFEVVAGTISLNATLSWDPAQFCLRFFLLAPGQEDEVPATACGTVGTGSSQVALADPVPGTWTYHIDAANPVNAGWGLSLRMPQEPRLETTMVDTVTVAPGAGYEINTQMPRGGTISWDWTASDTLHFNVHSHFNGTVQDYVDIDASEHGDSFTNDREGGYSLYWTNDGVVPVTLEYRVFGEYELESIFP